jgi:hypothetical protein
MNSRAGKHATTPSELAYLKGKSPRVARASQLWVLFRNRFRIHFYATVAWKTSAYESTVENRICRSAQNAEFYNEKVHETFV